MQISDKIMITLLFTVTAGSGLVCLWLWLAEHVYHRPVPLQIPSVYWPLTQLGFSRQPNVRKMFRLLFCELYRKRFWNPLINSWLKVKGFDRRRHLSTGNMHAASSVMVWMLIVFFLYFACRTTATAQFDAAHRFYVWAAMTALVEFIFNVPAIVLSRYLYLLTVRRPAPTPSENGHEDSHRNAA
jgi:hypothetical protein